MKKTILFQLFVGWVMMAFAQSSTICHEDGTVTFKYKNDGTPASAPLEAKNFTGLTLFIWSGVTSGTTCHPIIRIDNVRAVAY